MTATQASTGPDTPARLRARDRIFAVAKDLFYRRGIRAVGVETIVEAAGATKMSLYRSFPSKDALVAAYLDDRNSRYWAWWDEVTGPHAEPRAQLEAVLTAIASRTTAPDYRGCPFTNAAIEFPETDHPARAIAAGNKQELGRRLRRLAEQIGARDPAQLADQLLLLIEGAYSSSQTLGPDGPSRALVAAANTLIEAQLRDR
ncbi:MAG TPA: helix-turn-helix domain-containing protein [Alphaproteobacteria bacterium]